jgi:hypothetical protein
MHPYLENLKRQAEEQPLVALAVGTAALAAVTRLMQANTERTNSRTWSKEVERRRTKNS